MAELKPEEALLERACDLLVAIAQAHVMSRRNLFPGVMADQCGICGAQWPCYTYRLATGDIE